MNLVRLATGPSKEIPRHGLEIVRKLVSTNPEGLTTKEIFALALKEKPPVSFKYEALPLAPVKYGASGHLRQPAPLPPHPEHPIRSVRCVLYPNNRASSMFMKSNSYLKQAILPVLEGKNEVKLFRILREHVINQPHSKDTNTGKGKKKSQAAPPPPETRVKHAYVWKLVDRKRLAIQTAGRIKIKPKKPAFGVEVGVGEDWSHLNKRRQRARMGKVARDVQKMVELRKLRRKAAVEELEQAAKRKAHLKASLAVQERADQKMRAEAERVERALRRGRTPPEKKDTSLALSAKPSTVSSSLRSMLHI